MCRAGKNAPASASHRFKSQLLCFWCLFLPVHLQGKQQVSIQALEFLSPTWETWAPGSDPTQLHLLRTFRGMNGGKIIFVSLIFY